MRRSLAAVFCLCLAGALVAPSPAVAQLLTEALKGGGKALGAVSGATGPVLNALTPFTSPLNGLLQQALQPGAPVAELANAIAPLFRSVLAVLTSLAIPADPPIRPDEEALKYGLLGDSYTMTTSDGYVMTIFNVRSGNCNGYRSTVVLAPGLFSNGAAYVMRGEDSYAWMLAHRCHDVWMIPFRGTLFGRAHVNLTDQDEKFWDFNPYHYGAIDLPEQLEFVRKQAGVDKLVLSGADRTMAALLFMNDIHGERFQQHLAGAYVMVPAGYMAHQSSGGFAVLSILRDALTAVSKTGLSGEFPFMETSVHNVLGNLCKYSPITCFYLLNLLGGPTDEIDLDYVPSCFRNVLDSMSIDDLNWFNQQNGKVRQMNYFDYGVKLNLERYGQAKPPSVRLNATTIPCSLFAFQNSTVVTTADVIDTFNALAPSAQHYITELPGYNAASPYDPVDAYGLYGKMIDRMELDLEKEDAASADAHPVTMAVSAPSHKSTFMKQEQQHFMQQPLAAADRQAAREEKLIRKINKLLA